MQVACDTFFEETSTESVSSGKTDQKVQLKCKTSHSSTLNAIVKVTKQNTYSLFNLFLSHTFKAV